jgi:hypothetical protein
MSFSHQVPKLSNILRRVSVYQQQGNWLRKILTIHERDTWTHTICWPTIADSHRPLSDQALPGQKFFSYVITLWFHI